MSHKKGQVWVSAILYTLVAAVSIAFILQAGMPLIEGMRDRSVFTKMKNQMLALDQQIEQVASEGRGSQRFIPFEITQGQIAMDDQGLRWEMDTQTKIVEPRSSYRVGNLMVSANSDVMAVDQGTYYVMENSRIRVKLLKNGSANSHVNLSTDSFIKEITIKDTNETVTPQFDFKVANDDASKTGTGYTELSREGKLLGSASFVARMDTADYNYDLFITLDGEADFIRAEVKNFNPKD